MAKVKADIWMPLYIGDYLADTMHLTTEQHGAYILLIMAYWKNGGPLPGTQSALASICRLSGDAWSNAQAMLVNFFRIDPATGEWVHDRIDKELADATGNKERRVSKAKAAAEARWNKDASSNATSMPQAMHGECPSPSPIKEPPISPNGGETVVFDGEQFQVPSEIVGRWVKAYPRIDVDAEIKAAGAWAEANPKKRKKDWKRFLNTWLGNASKKLGELDEGECPVDKVIDLYHRICANLPRVAVKSDAVLRGLIVERWNESPDHQKSDFWKTIFDRANRMEQIYYRGSNVAPRLELICGRAIFRQLEESQ